MIHTFIYPNTKSLRALERKEARESFYFAFVLAGMGSFLVFVCLICI